MRTLTRWMMATMLTQPAAGKAPSPNHNSLSSQFMHENHVSACGHVNVPGVLPVVSRLDCLGLCLGGNELPCRITNFYSSIKS
ncbi:unnamed protein product [Ceratitis capitata]|uniref:(Mediterranean fruit fly) hypothetical protein n=1 Tax=Ceratitis capitata TaxID=7213 RepID=A0A811U2T5_CERCA|nr:unnamed protein product [Ceratitis capitata]